MLSWLKKSDGEPIVSPEPKNLPPIVQLAADGARLPIHLIVSPGSARALDFQQKLHEIARRIESLHHDPRAVMAAHELLEIEIADVARWQTRELEMLVVALTDAIRQVQKVMFRSLEQQDGILDDMQGIEDGLTRAVQADDLAGVKLEIEREMQRLHTLVERQTKAHGQLRGQYLETVSVLEDRLNEAETASRTDHLTRLGNRAAYDYFLNAMMEKAKNGGVYSLAVIDLDGFKPINDTYGHAAGDAVLSGVAGRMREAAGDKAFIARTGGDEFAVIAAMDPRTLDRKLQRFSDELGRKPLRVGDPPVAVKCGASCGVTQIRFDDTVETVTHRADELMYAKKRVRRAA